MWRRGCRSDISVFTPFSTGGAFVFDFQIPLIEPDVQPRAAAQLTVFTR
jgi:hypothetical protein